jgi:hypothetical protein
MGAEVDRAALPPRRLIWSLSWALVRLSSSVMMGAMVLKSGQMLTKALKVLAWISLMRASSPDGNWRRPPTNLGARGKPATAGNANRGPPSPSTSHISASPPPSSSSTVAVIIIDWPPGPAGGWGTATSTAAPSPSPSSIFFAKLIYYSTNL